MPDDDLIYPDRSFARGYWIAVAIVAPFWIGIALLAVVLG